MPAPDRGRVAEGLGVAWDTANDAVQAEGKRILINDENRFDVTATGVDEHVWRHTRRGDKFPTVIIDLTALRDGTGPPQAARHGRGTLQAGIQDLARRPTPSMARRGRRRRDGGGFKTAAAEEIPTAVAVDPFHVVRLAGDALDRCRRRVQLAIHGHRGFKDDPLYKLRRTLHTGADLLTDKQIHRLHALFAGDDHVELEATWGIYQPMITAYREPNRTKGRELLSKLIDDLGHSVPKVLSEIITLCRTLPRRASGCTSVTQPAPGSEARTRTSTACCASTSRSRPTSPSTPRPTWTESSPTSTDDPPDPRRAQPSRAVQRLLTSQNHPPLQ